MTIENIFASISGLGGLVISIIAIVRTVIVEKKINEPDVEILLENITHETKPTFRFINNGKSVYVDSISFTTNTNYGITDIPVQRRFKRDSDELIDMDIHDGVEPIMYHVWKAQCKKFIYAKVKISNNKEIKIKVDVEGIYELQRMRHLND